MSRWDDFADDHPRASRRLRKIRSVLPPLNFITIHYAYFTIIPLIASVIFWGSSNPGHSISYVDSLFLVVSAMTEAGLNTVNLSQMTTWQQVILFLLIMLGSTIWVSIWTVLARKHVFEQRFEDIVRTYRLTGFHRDGSSMSFGLPMIRRFTSFRKAKTVPAEEQGLPLPGTGTRITSPSQPRRTKLGTLHGGPQEYPVEYAGRPISLERTNSLPEVERDEPLPPLQPPSMAPRAAPGPPTTPTDQSGHIAFVESPRPTGMAPPSDSIANGHANAHSNGFTTSRSHQQDQPNQPIRRHQAGAGAKNDVHEKDMHLFDMRHFLQHRHPGRNGQFHDLTSEEREHLGGCEYRALKILAIIVPVYFFLWQLLGCLALGAWIHHNMPDTARNNGINPWWLGIFDGVSAFNNSGMSLLDANMIPFQSAYYVLITMGLLILAGNTAYPIFLRLILWSALKLMKLTSAEHEWTEIKATFDFILKYPRRVYTNLFPTRQTWWLVFMLVSLNSVDWVAFELLNIGNRIIESIPTGARVLDGLFQALAVRSGGFYVVPIANVYIGLQVLYVIMMYISVYPVVITMRNSNVYEERSLGIYADDTSSDLSSSVDLETADSNGIPLRRTSSTQSDLLPEQPGPPISPRTMRPTLTRRISHSGPALQLGKAVRRTFTRWHGVGVITPPRSSSPINGSQHQPTGGGRHSHKANSHESRISFITQQIHGQLAHDIWWLTLAVLVIVTIETSHFNADPVTFSVFNVIFEVVSAYGCVGISVGLPTQAYSFAGGWHTPSKLVLCLVMLRGRHRGLPVALDRAVRLPAEQLHRDEDEDWRIRRTMTHRRMGGE